MTIGQRVEIFINNLNIRQLDFAAKIGCSPSYLSQIIQGKKGRGVGIEMVSSILKAYPELNPKWLIEGLGDMYLSNGKENTNENDMMLSEEIKFLKKQLEEKDKQISKLLNLLSLTTSENEEDKKEDVA